LKRIIRILFQVRTQTLTCNPATQQPSNPATQQPSNPATQQPSNPATQQPSNPATQQPRLTAVSQPFPEPIELTVIVHPTEIMEAQEAIQEAQEVITESTTIENILTVGKSHYDC
jgi:hypothetical protein